MSASNDYNTVLQLRNDYRACVKVARETDSKKEERHLMAEAEELLKRLKTECPHEHSFSINRPYRDSSNDYDQIGNRICLCCGIRESAWEEKDYKILKTEFDHYSGHTHAMPNTLKDPLSHLLTECIEDARKTWWNR